MRVAVLPLMLAPAPSGLSHEAPRRAQRRVLLGLSLALLAGSLLLLIPFWASLVLALWTSALMRPFVDRLTRAVRGRRGAAALVTVGILLAALIPVVAGIAVVAPDVIELVQRALTSSSGHNALVELVSGGGKSPADSARNAREVVKMVASQGSQAWTVAALLAGFLGSAGLGALVYFVVTYAALVYGREAYDWLRAQVPLAPAHLDRWSAAFVETGRGLLYSVALTALMIAALATAAYVALGIPRAFALGLATFLASLIPAIGPFLVWGPVSLGLLLAGHGIKAAVLAGICIALVAPIDHLVRPFLARRGKLQLHPFLVFVSMFGGIVSVGGSGLILGPLLFRLALEGMALVREAQTTPR